MEKNMKILIVLFAFFIVSMLGFGFMMKLLILENSECTTNPFTYGANLLTEQGFKPVLCSCSALNGQFAPFTYDNEKVWVEEDLSPSRNNIVLNFNLSEHILE